MKFTRILFFAAVALCVIACKDEEEETSMTMNGSLGAKMPSYVYPGDYFDFCLSKTAELSRSDDDTKTTDINDEIFFSFTNPFTSKIDTLENYTDTYRLTIPDTLGQFTFYAKANAEGYYVKTASLVFYVVNPSLENGSITEHGIDTRGPSIIDSRDNKRYYYKTIAGTDWFKQNLAYEGCGVPFSKEQRAIDLFGGYYTYNEALTACPQGWRLPSEEDFYNLAKELGASEPMGSEYAGIAKNLIVYAYFNDSAMWTYRKELKGDNKSGLCVFPCGFATVENDYYKFIDLGTYAAFWTSDQEDSQGIYRYIYEKEDRLFKGVQSKDNFASSVRCVRN